MAKIAGRLKAIQALQEVGISRLQHGIMLCMILDDRCWSISALSNATGYTRTAVRRALRRAREHGQVVPLPSGAYMPSETGSVVFQRIVGELNEITNGHRGAWSEYVLDKLHPTPGMKALHSMA